MNKSLLVGAGDVSSPLRAWTGPMSAELELTSGRFGLGKVPSRLAPDALARAVCGYCSTGCSLEVHLKEGVATNLTPTRDYPVNLGMACPKGWEALTPLDAPDRALSPLVRGADGSMAPMAWEDALRMFCDRMKGIQERHGNHSIAFLSTGQICTEEMALLGTLFKFGMGGLHCDSNTRQCMATSHVAYKQSFGFDAPPFTYADFEESETLVFIGSNICIAHPILWQRVLRNPRKPRIIVIDPRRTETAMNATDHLPLRPKTDLCLLYGVANILLCNGWLDRGFIEAHTTGFDDFAEFLRGYPPDKVAAETGLSVGQIYRLADTIHQGKAVSFWWTMGVNQSHESTRTAQAIINLALMTGNIGRPGTGCNSITGQCNAMGSRLFANISSLPGGHDFRNEEHRAKIARIFGIAEDRIPREPSMAYDQILDAVDRGEIRGLWIIATNTIHSWIHSQSFARLRKKLEFLVVQDLYTTTDTARLADLILPAAGWGEKEGTLINSERRIGVVRKVRRPPGQAMSDFNIFRLIGHYWGCDSFLERWSTPEAAFHLLRQCSKGQPCDITGIGSYDFVEAQGGVQWPFPAAAAEGGASPGRERRLFEDGNFFTPDRKARFLYDPPRNPPETTSEEYPFVLLTGRGTSAQWHTNTRTGKSAILRQLYPERVYVELHPEDARRLGIVAGGKARVESRRGSIVAAAFLTTSVQPGHIFIPMHYEEANKLTFPAFDPHSRQPSYKYCAVRVLPTPS